MVHCTASIDTFLLATQSTSLRFAQLGIRDHEALPSIISIGDVGRNDFEALLSVLYPM